MNKTQKTLLYVGGYPRSGTTLLDRLLGADPSIAGLGEVVLAFDYVFDGAARCGCGLSFDVCDVWRPVRTGFPELQGSSAHRSEFETRRLRYETSLLRLILAPRGSADVIQYLAQSERFWSYLDQSTGASNFMVDSSKSGADSIWRPVALSWLAGRDVRVLHLVRDVRGVMLSHYRGSNMVMEKIENSSDGGANPSWTLLHWLYVNMKASLYRFLLPSGCYLLIRYEDLAASPVETLSVIYRFLGLVPGPYPANTRPERFHVGGHQVYGNRMRRQREVRIAPDNAWLNELPWWLRGMGGLAMALWDIWARCLGLLRRK